MTPQLHQAEAAIKRSVNAGPGGRIVPGRQRVNGGHRQVPADHRRDAAAGHGAATAPTFWDWCWGTTTLGLRSLRCRSTSLWYLSGPMSITPMK